MSKLESWQVTISERIRSLSQEGLSVSQIAQLLGIRYQHAYNVLNQRTVTRGRNDDITAATQTRAFLLEENLIGGGFQRSSRWVLTKEGEIALQQPLPKEVGVYTFVKEGVAQYVGVATMGLAKRIYFYAKPGPTQRTSQRLNMIIKNELAAGSFIDIYTAAPPDLEWNGFPIHGSAGLELALIKKYALPWNIRSSG
nr:GIY-YIG nuclease family protein [Methylocystis sp. H4A]